MASHASHALSTPLPYQQRRSDGSESCDASDAAAPPPVPSASGRITLGSIALALYADADAAGTARAALVARGHAPAQLSLVHRAATDGADGADGAIGVLVGAVVVAAPAEAVLVARGPLVAAVAAAAAEPALPDAWADVPIDARSTPLARALLSAGVPPHGVLGAERALAAGRVALLAHGSAAEVARARGQLADTSALQLEVYGVARHRSVEG